MLFGTNHKEYNKLGIKILLLYLKEVLLFISTYIWIGIWTAIGFIIVTKATGVFVILTS